MGTKLIRQGGRLAVLGCEAKRSPLSNYWHVCRPGISLPVLDGAGSGDGLRIGTSLCGKEILTNGYAADFAPALGALCPACRERL